MSVAEQLGLAELEQGLAEARRLWPGWVERDPRLAVAPGVDGLQDWLLSIGRDAADEVLHALVRIASPAGDDCRAAAWVVAWALLPGAIAVARRGPSSRDTDALVGGQLWLEIRQFPWWRDQKVAGNVLANTRSALTRDGDLKRASWAERRTAPTARLPERQLAEEPTPDQELAEVLAAAEQLGVIRSAERVVLSSLVEQTDRVAPRAVCRTGGGLMSAPALAATAAELGLSPSAVRRRARRSIDALAAAGRSGRLSSWT